MDRRIRDGICGCKAKRGGPGPFRNLRYRWSIPGFGRSKSYRRPLRPLHQQAVLEQYPQSLQGPLLVVFPPRLPWLAAAALGLLGRML